MSQGWGSGGYGPPPAPGGWGPTGHAPAPGPHGPPGYGAPSPYGLAPFPGGPLATTMQCRFCGSSGPHFTISKVSPAGWVIFGVLLFAFMPLCWVGLFMKQRGLQCGSCRQWIVPLS